MKYTHITQYGVLMLAFLNIKSLRPPADLLFGTITCAALPPYERIQLCNKENSLRLCILATTFDFYRV